MKKIITTAACLCMLMSLFVPKLSACDRSYLTLDTVVDLGGGNYDITLTFCTGNGQTGVNIGGDANTGTWELHSLGATITAYPATLTSGITGAVFPASLRAGGQVLRYTNPGVWWTCVNTTCGPISTYCHTFTVTTSGLPGAMRIIGAEAANIFVNGCFLNSDLTVYPNPACSTSTLSSSINVVNTSCTTRTLDVTVTGGTAPYSSIWYASGYPSTEDLTVSNSIIYFGSVIDANGCASTHTAGVSITTPVASAGPDQQLYIGYGATCVNLNGSASSGTSPYTYAWSTGATTATINVCPTSTTNYTLTVTDALGCTSTDVATVNVTDIRCGTNKVYVCHGGLTKCYSTNQVAAHLGHGDYLGTCTAKFTGTPAQATTELEVYPNPAAGEAFFNITLAEAGVALIEILDLHGRVVWTQRTTLMEEGDSQTLNADLNLLGAGLYLVKMSTTDGHSILRKLVVNK